MRSNRRLDAGTLDVRGLNTKWADAYKRRDEWNRRYPTGTHVETHDGKQLKTIGSAFIMAQEVYVYVEGKTPVPMAIADLTTAGETL